MLRDPFRAPAPGHQGTDGRGLTGEVQVPVLLEGARAADVGAALKLCCFNGPPPHSQFCVAMSCVMFIQGEAMRVTSMR